MNWPNPVDLVVGPDGRMSMPKLAAATAHLNMCVAFAYLQWGNAYNETLWITYAGFALGHHLINKAGDQVSAFKDKKLDAEVAVGEVTK